MFSNRPTSSQFEKDDGVERRLFSMAIEGLRFLIEKAQVEYLLKSTVEIMPQHALGEAKAYDNFISKLLLALHLASTHNLGQQATSATAKGLY
jgi:hypothetical protein